MHVHLRIKFQIYFFSKKSVPLKSPTWKESDPYFLWTRTPTFIKTFFVNQFITNTAYSIFSVKVSSFQAFLSETTPGALTTWNFTRKRNPWPVFSIEFWEIFKKTLFMEHIFGRPFLHCSFKNFPFILNFV